MLSRLKKIWKFNKLKLTEIINYFFQQQQQQQQQQHQQQQQQANQRNQSNGMMDPSRGMQVNFCQLRISPFGLIYFQERFRKKTLQHSLAAFDDQPKLFSIDLFWMFKIWFPNFSASSFARKLHFQMQIYVWHKFDLLSTPQSRLRNLRVT